MQKRIHFRYVNTLCFPGNVSIPKSLANFKWIRCSCYVLAYRFGSITFPNCLLGISPSLHDRFTLSKPQVPTNPHTLQPPPLTTNDAPIKPLATKSTSSSAPNPCKLYMQGHCRYRGKGIGCSYPHLPMCFKFIKSGHKGCSKGDSCKYTHIKLCRSSLLSQKCDRIKCYFYHVTCTVRPNLNQDLPKTTVPKRPASQPTPLMHIRLPPSHPTDTTFPHRNPHHIQDYNVGASSKTPDITSAFLDQMKDLKTYVKLFLRSSKLLCYYFCMLNSKLHKKGKLRDIPISLFVNRSQTFVD